MFELDSIDYILKTDYVQSIVISLLKKKTAGKYIIITRNKYI